MSPTDKSLWLACFWTVTAAIVGRTWGLLPACGIGLLALLLTFWQRRAGPWIWAWPAAFAAGLPPVPVYPPRPGPIQIEGRVQAPVHFDASEGRCSFRIEHRGQVFLCVIAGAPRDFQVLPGDRVRGPGRYPEQPMRLVRGGLPRVRTSHDALTVSREGLAHFSWKRLATACRLAMQDALLEAVPGESGRLLCLLTLGSGPRLEGDLPSAHRATGLSHLLAVSGAHLTMLAWMLGALAFACTRLPALGSPWFRRGCLVILVLYGAITGLEPPMFRAVVAVSVFFLGVGHGRRIPMSAVLCLPAILTALLMPRDLFGISFNLSYAAVYGLFLSNGLTGRSTFERWVKGPAICSVWASLLTMPLTLWYFGRVAPWAILATPLLSPVVALLLGLSLLVATCSQLPGIGWLLSFPLSGLTELYCASVRGLSTMPLAPCFASSRPEPLMLLTAGMIGALGLLYWRDRRGVATLCLALSLPHFLPGPTGGVEPGLQLLAVGHGHAALLHLPDGTRVLVDCGTLGARRVVTRQVAAATLPYRHVDWLIVTHGDHDHIGCIVDLLESVVVDRALLPLEMRDSEVADGLRRQGCRLQFLAAGQRRRVAAGLLAHRPSTAGDRNDQSAWIHAEFGSFSAILPGDALEAGVAAWLACDLACTADVLVLPHHGRPHRGIGELLSVVRPGLALVSSPATDGVSAQGAAARAAGCQVLHTGLVGHIQVRGTVPPTIRTEFPLRLLGQPGQRRR